METRIKICGEIDVNKEIINVQLLPNITFFHEFGTKIYLIEFSFFIIRILVWFGKTKDVWNIARGNWFYHIIN